MTSNTRNILGFLLMLALLTGCTGPGGSGSPTVAVPESNSVVYVLNSLSRTLTAIDLHSGTVARSTTTLQTTGNDLVLRPGTNELWALHSETADVYRFTYSASDPRLAPVFTDDYSLFPGENGNPYSLAFSTNGNRFYVTNLLGNTVSSYDATSTFRYSNTIVGFAPEGVAVLPNGNVVVSLTNYLAPGSYGVGTIAVLDSMTYDTIRTLQVGINPQVVRYYNGYLYVVCTGDFGSHYGSLWKVRASDLQVEGAPYAFAGYPGDLAIDVDSTSVPGTTTVKGYFPAWSLGSSTTGSVEVVDLTSLTFVHRYIVDGGPLRAISLPDGGVAVSLFAGDRILVFTRTGGQYLLSADDGPTAMAAVLRP